MMGTGALIPSLIPDGSETMSSLVKQARAFWRDDEGVTAIEYGLIAALIAVVIILAVTAVGGGLENIFNYIAGQLTT